jgi:hypothetical protein
MSFQETIDYVIHLSLVCGLETGLIIQSLVFKGFDSDQIGNAIAEARRVLK